MGDRLRVGIPYRYVTSQLGQLSLVSLWGRLIEYPLLSALALLSACILAVFFFFMLFVHSCTYIT